jgi:RNA polymerase sigma factor (sigma-70 family)
VSQAGFDPAVIEREQNLARRLAAAVQRIGDPDVIERVQETLASGSATELFGRLTDSDPRVVNAAHECVMLRFAYVVAVAARTFGFDTDQRDDLVQRTFLELPAVVARSAARGVAITNPDGWLRQRAYLIARQMRREERSTRARDVRAETDAVDALPASPEDALLVSVDASRTRERIDEALRVLAAEQPVWTELLRLHYREGLRLDEVAARLGRSHGTVRNDAQKARVRLAAIILERFPDLLPLRQETVPEGDDAAR